LQALATLKAAATGGHMAVKPDAGGLALEKIGFAGAQFRRDIAAKAF
jgi:hypothetical protein